MPQFILIVLACCGVWWLFNKFVSDAEKLSRRSARRRKEQLNGVHGTLVQDLATGEYHVNRDEA